MVTAAETIEMLEKKIDELETERALFEMTASVQAAKTLDHRQEIALSLLPKLIQAMADDPEIVAFRIADHVLQEGIEKKVVCPMCKRRMESEGEEVEPGEDTPEPETDESTFREESTVNPSE